MSRAPAVLDARRLERLGIEPAWSRSLPVLLADGERVRVHGLDEARAPLTFPEFGNIGPASIPFTLARVQDEIKAGDRVLCMGMGSGLNASVVEIIW